MCDADAVVGSELPLRKAGLGPFDCVKVPHHLLSRLLYMNPVCLLTAASKKDTQMGVARGIMVSSGRTPHTGVASSNSRCYMHGTT